MKLVLSILLREDFYPRLPSNGHVAEDDLVLPILRLLSLSMEPKHGSPTPVHVELGTELRASSL